MDRLLGNHCSKLFLNSKLISNETENYGDGYSSPAVLKLRVAIPQWFPPQFLVGCEADKLIVDKENALSPRESKTESHM